MLSTNPTWSLFFNKEGDLRQTHRFLLERIRGASPELEDEVSRILFSRADLREKDKALILDGVERRLGIVVAHSS